MAETPFRTGPTDRLAVWLVLSHPGKGSQMVVTFLKTTVSSVQKNTGLISIYSNNKSAAHGHMCDPVQHFVATISKIRLKMPHCPEAPRHLLAKVNMRVGLSTC